MASPIEKVPVRCPSCKGGFMVVKSYVGPNLKCPACNTQWTHLAAGAPKLKKVPADGAAAPSAPAAKSASGKVPVSLVGRTLAGRFRVTGVITQGRLGPVYAAEDQKVRTAVVVKSLPDAVLAKLEPLSSLKHRNIEALIAVDRTPGSGFAAFELVRGGSSADFVRQYGPMAQPDCARVISAAAEGLAAVHAAGHVHGGVRPSNLLLGEDWTIKLGGLGMPRAGADLPVEAVPFLSPEQSAGRSPDARSDVYALGACYYTLLTGRPPFEGAGREEVLRKVASEAAPDARALVPGLPSAVVKLLERTLAKNPADRPATAAELRSLVGRIADGALSQSGVVDSPWAETASPGDILAGEIESELPPRGGPVGSLSQILEAAGGLPTTENIPAPPPPPVRGPGVRDRDGRGGEDADRAPAGRASDSGVRKGAEAPAARDDRDRDRDRDKGRHDRGPGRAGSSKPGIPAAPVAVAAAPAGFEFRGLVMAAAGVIVTGVAFVGALRGDHPDIPPPPRVGGEEAVVTPGGGRTSDPIVRPPDDTKPDVSTGDPALNALGSEFANLLRSQPRGEGTDAEVGTWLRAVRKFVAGLESRRNLKPQELDYLRQARDLAKGGAYAYPFARMELGLPDSVADVSWPDFDRLALARSEDGFYVLFDGKSHPGLRLGEGVEFDAKDGTILVKAGEVEDLRPGAARRRANGTPDEDPGSKSGTGKKKRRPEGSSGSGSGSGSGSSDPKPDGKSGSSEKGGDPSGGAALWNGGEGVGGEMGPMLAEARGVPARGIEARHPVSDRPGRAASGGGTSSVEPPVSEPAPSEGKTAGRRPANPYTPKETGPADKTGKNGPATSGKASPPATGKSGGDDDMPTSKTTAKKKPEYVPVSFRIGLNGTVPFRNFELIWSQYWRAGGVPRSGVWYRRTATATLWDKAGVDATGLYSRLVNDDRTWTEPPLNADLATEAVFDTPAMVEMRLLVVGNEHRLFVNGKQVASRRSTDTPAAGMPEFVVTGSAPLLWRMCPRYAMPSGSFTELKGRGVPDEAVTSLRRHLGEGTFTLGELEDAITDALGTEAAEHGDKVRRAAVLRHGVRIMVYDRMKEAASGG